MEIGLSRFKELRLDVSRPNPTPKELRQVLIEIGVIEDTGQKKETRFSEEQKWTIVERLLKAPRLDVEIIDAIIEYFYFEPLILQMCMGRKEISIQSLHRLEGIDKEWYDKIQDVPVELEQDEYEWYRPYYEEWRAEESIKEFAQMEKWRLEFREMMRRIGVSPSGEKEHQP